MVKFQSGSSIVAKDVMTAPVVCVEPDEGLVAVEQRLIDAHITGLPVVISGELVGIITRSDFVRLPILLKTLDEYVEDRRHENGLQQQFREEFHELMSRLGDLTVGDVMTRNVVTCNADTPVSGIAAKMVSHHVHRVVVVDGTRPIGIVGSLDLVRLLEHG
jgi:CBS domain-containing protein